jgi:hypothetical protein
MRSPLEVADEPTKSEIWDADARGMTRLMSVYEVISDVFGRAGPLLTLSGDVANS